MSNSIKRLSWDSSFFGYEVGMIEIEHPLNFSYENFLEQTQDYKLIYIFSPQKILHPSLHLVDEKLTFERKISTEDLRKSITSVFSITSFDPLHHDLERLKELTLLSGIYSRFYTDPNFVNQEYESLYIEWINKSVKGDKAFDTLIYTIKDKIVGFITLSKKNSTLADIGLIAVDNNFRGQGIASDLIAAAIKAAGNKNFKKIQVVTQSANKPAVSLYKKTMFEEKSLINIYHHWNL